MTPAPVGVLLANLGTPDAPTAPALRRYLAEFLADRRVVDVNRVLWWGILHGIILRVRPKRSAALYANIWTQQGPPLLVIGKAQRQGVADLLGNAYRVELGMRYGTPAIAPALDRLAAAGCAHVVVLPLFPQYSSATTASVLDAVAAWAKGRRDVPGFTFVRGFADHPAWIRALAADIERAGVRPTPAEPLLLSFHGIPQRYADTGDPYAEECAATARALATELRLPDGAWRVVYQSRFGREAWLKPYAFEEIERLARSGTKSLSILSAAFVADCLESIDEIGREGKRVFEEAGGERYVRVPCPNDSPEALEALATIVREHTPLPRTDRPSLDQPRTDRP